MGIPIHSRWGPPLEQYVLRYNRTSVRGQEVLENDIMSSARSCMEIIATISKEEDEIKFDLLARQVTLEMLGCLLFLSSSVQGVLYLAQPPLIRGCIRLMKIIKVDGVVSPLSYEYGYLCFNIAKMALGVCLVEKINKQHIGELMKRIWANYQTKDNPSILTEQLSEIFLNEIAKSSPREARCDWIFGWSDPPAHGGHSNLIVAESDALDLMNVLWNDRKALLKSLSLTYTPGALTILLLIWQYMLRNGLQHELPAPPLRTPLLGPFLDLSWRFVLVATPSDYGFILPMVFAAMSHLGKLVKGAVDVEDSRTIINAYINGIMPIENAVSFRQATLVICHNLPRFVVHNILPGTEELFPVLVKSMLGRMWETIFWEGLEMEHIMPPMGILAGGVEDLLLFLQIHAPRLPPQSPVMQAILEEMADNDLLGLVGFSVHRLYPSRESDTTGLYKDLSSCIEFRNAVRSMIAALAQASSTSVAPPYFREYATEWVKHLQYNDVLLQMTGKGDNASSWATFRQELLWDVIRMIGSSDDAKECLESRLRISCNYARCPNPSWAGYAQLCCSSCATSPEGASYCSSRCQILDWKSEGQKTHQGLCPRSN
ncbi:hypothetical protein RSAG8_04041, partial [Rhizoctonia solani AG-8 WAC10335]